MLDHNRKWTTALDHTALAHKLGFIDVVAVGSTDVIARQLDLAQYAHMQAAFDDLAGRAETANPFMSPALVMAAAAGLAARKIVVLAAFDGSDPDRLLGAWCLRRQRDVWSAGCEVLQAPILPRYECLSSPVLDKTHAKAAFSAMLAHVKAADDLPGIVRATSWPRVLEHLLPHSWHAAPAETWQRAVMHTTTAVQDSETYLKRSMGKALNKRNSRQRQLSEQGLLAITNKRGIDAVSAFEHYVRLEAKGWKGQAGTSLAEVPADAAYMRAAIARLAGADRVSVDMISLDGSPIAVGVVVEAAGNNLFWKAAFDEDHARFAPGSLLHLAVTRRLFAEGRPALDSGMMEFTNPAYMPWSERADMARATISCSAAGLLVRAGAALRHALRRLRMKFAKA
ncbi:MAG: GNAT family N-acetyltransferase [Bosea sp. (in: a-proteobacteria)]